MYDAIICGARVAGSPTAMLLARKGRRVLVVDRASFPSDTYSTHFVTVVGTELLDRWGALDRLRELDVPVYGNVTMSMPGNRFGTDAVGLAPEPACSPRRTDLDHVLLEMAADAGAEVRTETTVTEILRDDQGRPRGVRLRDAAGAESEVEAPVVVGADGRTSLVARTMAPAERDRHKIRGAAVFAYFDDVEADQVVFGLFPSTLLFLFPTKSRSACIGCAVNDDDDAAIKADPEAYFWKKVALDPVMEANVRGGTRDGRWRLGDLPDGWFREASGPGWALVGDALCLKDPLMGHGITDSFVGAELLSDAIDRGLSAGGVTALDSELARYDQAVWKALRPVYEANRDIATYDWEPDDGLKRVSGVALMIREELAALRAGELTLDALTS